MKKWKFIKRCCTQSRLENWLLVLLRLLSVIFNLCPLSLFHFVIGYMRCALSILQVHTLLAVKIFIHWYAIPFAYHIRYSFHLKKLSVFDRINDISSLILVLFILCMIQANFFSRWFRPVPSCSSLSLWFFHIFFFCLWCWRCKWHYSKKHSIFLG